MSAELREQFRREYIYFQQKKRVLDMLQKDYPELETIIPDELIRPLSRRQKAGVSLDVDFYPNCFKTTITL